MNSMAVPSGAFPFMIFETTINDNREKILKTINVNRAKIIEDSQFQSGYRWWIQHVDRFWGWVLENDRFVHWQFLLGNSLGNRSYLNQLSFTREISVK